jgi:hypothetical protein
MLPRFLVVAKYELAQYRGSVVDEAVVLLVLLAGFLMLVTPEVGEASLPSSHKIYRVGCLEGSVFEGIESYSLEFIPYKSRYEMISASSLNEVDAFATRSRGRIVVFGSGTVKSDAVLSHLNNLLSELNTNLVYDYVNMDESLSGVLLPLRLRIVEEEIDYSSAINGSMEAKRRRVLGDLRFIGDEEAEVESPAASETGYLLPASESSGEAQSMQYPPGVGESPAGAGEPPAVTSPTDLLLPVDLTVEFPFKTLYKNMTLISPLILVSILLALSLARERVDRNIENLFESPLSRADILLGKSFPYMACLTILCVLYGLQVSVSFDAVKVALVFTVLSATMLSFSLFSVLVSRSYRELTFIGSFSLFGFFFFIVLPNVFSGVNVLAFISPLDAVTSIENGASIPSSELALSLLPYCFLSLFFVSFTGLCFNAEVMFSSMGFSNLLSLFYKTLSRLLSRGFIYVSVSVALLVPFIFIVESILAYMVLPLGRLTPFASLILLAAVEELVKITPFYYRRMNAVFYGAVAGSSFFLMEKLFNLYLIVKVYTYLGGPYVFFFRNLAPTLAVHILATTVFASIVGRTNSRLWFTAGLTLSVLIHFTYNYMLITGLL